MAYDLHSNVCLPTYLQDMPTKEPSTLGPQQCMESQKQQNSNNKILYFVKMIINAT